MSELIATRQAFGEALYEIMKEDERVVALTADLGESLRMLKIKEEMPERFYDVGVAEANMVGVAAGMALGGSIPVAGTFGVFLSRAYDHIRVQICQNGLNAVLVGSHGGVSNAADGGSAHALEDIAYMRALPNMTVVFPADAAETKAAVKEVITADGPVYLRLYREPTPLLPKDAGDFQLGKGKVLKEGKDVTIVGTGPQAVFALEAADLLEKDGINTEVISVSTIKPLDYEPIVSSAAKTKKVVTVEDHNINGGLGSAVAEALSEHCPTKVHRIAVTQFGESGSYTELAARMGIDAQGIYRRVKAVLNTK